MVKRKVSTNPLNSYYPSFLFADIDSTDLLEKYKIFFFFLLISVTNYNTRSKFHACITLPFCSLMILWVTLSAEVILLLKTSKYSCIWVNSSGRLFSPRTVLATALTVSPILLRKPGPCFLWDARSCKQSNNNHTQQRHWNCTHSLKTSVNQHMFKSAIINLRGERVQYVNSVLVFYPNCARRCWWLEHNNFSKIAD